MVNAAYNIRKLSYGREYIIPKPLDPRLLTTVSPAVAKAAIKSGVARKKINDWNKYDIKLRDLIGGDNKMLRRFFDVARQNPKRVVFSESNHLNMLKAAEAALAEKICYPVLLGNGEKIRRIAAENDIDLQGIEILNIRLDEEEDRRLKYAAILAEKRGREGMTFDEAYEKMYERNYFGMMMVETGEADALITGVYSRYSDSIRAATEVVGIRDGLKHIGAMHIMNTKKGVFFIADTLFNRHPSTETLIDIAKLTYNTVQFFNHDPVMAMLSYSNFGSVKNGSPASVHQAVKILHEKYPDMCVDGEMQVTFALDTKLRDRKYPFSRLKNKQVNTLIFPNLSSANTAYRLLIEMGLADTIGPIQMGLNKPIHILDVESSVRDIVNMTAVAVLDALVDEQREWNKRSQEL